MANTYYDSQLTAAQIESALEAVSGVIVPANNGKVLYINNGKIDAKSVVPGGAVLESLSATQNGDYYPGIGVDGFDEVHVDVPSGSTLITKNITQNGTYNASSDNADGYSQVVVNVSGGGGGGDFIRSLFVSGSYSVNRDGDKDIITLNIANSDPTTVGIIFVATEETVSIKYISGSGGTPQSGTCAYNSYMPYTISQGSGRLSYNNYTAIDQEFSYQGTYIFCGVYNPTVGSTYQFEISRT